MKGGNPPLISSLFPSKGRFHTLSQNITNKMQFTQRKLRQAKYWYEKQIQFLKKKFTALIYQIFTIQIISNKIHARKCITCGLRIRNKRLNGKVITKRTSHGTAKLIFYETEFDGELLHVANHCFCQPCAFCYWPRNEPLEFR